MSKFTYTLLILFTHFIAFQSIGQTPSGTITGIVTTHGNMPLSGVSVLVRNTSIGTATNEKGEFILKQLSAQTYDIEFSYVGYQTASERATVTANKTVFLSIALNESNTSLPEATIISQRNSIEVNRLPDIHQTYIMTGKKNEVISLAGTHSNLAEKTGRQLFAKVPGVFIYDMDGAGNQINISTRGLDAHRSWEYNIRQNEVITNSDIYGYPASHYSPPMEAINRIELMRGTASLQYGAQFGGMINYVTKSPDTSKIISIESINTVGSFGLFSSYTAISGKKSKWQYYTYYHKRISDGYRQNSRSEADAYFAGLTYSFNRNISLKAELGHSRYIYQLPGPLTDSMFYQNPRQSTRSRNYFNPDIYVPSLTFSWAMHKKTKLTFITSAVLGSRNSVLFDKFANVPDVIDTVTHQYKSRQVDIDNFNSYTSDLRLLHEYQVGSFRNILSGGITYMNNRMHRRQLGKGSDGTGFDLTRIEDAWGRDLYYHTQNIAFSVENLLYVSNKLSITPGLRIENGSTTMSGNMRYLESKDIPHRLSHRFPLFGISMQYQPNLSNKIYAGISQAYRPVLFKDLIPGSVLEKADKNMKDAFGYNAELGISGNYKRWLLYDVSVFQVWYHNRAGSLLLNDNNHNPYIYKTNIGSSRTNGIELYTEVIPLRTSNLSLSLYTSSSYFDAIYQKAAITTGGENTDISGNRVESVPEWISRSGINFSYKTLKATLQYSFVSETYSDAFNTILPSANGARGLVPAYGIWDCNASFRFARHYLLKAGVNNLANKQYFTKRPTFYPGPGIWSSDGRSIFISLAIKI